MSRSDAIANDDTEARDHFSWLKSFTPYSNIENEYKNDFPVRK